MSDARKISQPSHDTQTDESSPNNSMDSNQCPELSDGVVATLKSAVAAYKSGDSLKADKLFQAASEELNIAIRTAVQQMSASSSPSLVEGLASANGRLQQKSNSVEPAARKSLVDALSNILTNMDNSLWRDINISQTLQAEILMESVNTSMLVISAGGANVRPVVDGILQVCRVLPLIAASPSSTGTAAAFLTVDSWFYPLTAGTSVRCHPGIGAFLFPSAEPGGPAIGLVLSDSATRETLASLLTQLGLTVLDSGQKQNEQVQPSVAASPSTTAAPGAQPIVGARSESTPSASRDGSPASPFAQGYIAAGSWMENTLRQGTTMASDLLQWQGDVIRSILPLATDDATVHPFAAGSARALRNGSDLIATCSGLFVEALSDAVSELSRRLMPVITKNAPKLTPPAVRNVLELVTPTGRTIGNEIVQMAYSGLRGVGHVYHQLEQATKTLGRTLASETVKTVGHVYGTPTARLTEDTLWTVGNVATATSNLQNAAVKAIAAQVTREASAAPAVDEGGTQRHQAYGSSSV